MYCTERTSKHIRPYLQENTGSRPLSHSQACKGRISSWVGDDQRIPAVVCFLLILLITSFFLQVMYTGNSNRPSASLMVMANKLAISILLGGSIAGCIDCLPSNSREEPLFMQGTWSLVI